MLKNRFILYTIFTALMLTGCAKRGTIDGGPRDSIPPILVGSSPKNMSTEFTGSEIRIDFNEYIKIKDVSKQLIISPPMNTPPAITPMGSASKYIKIKIKDTLQPNTTYSFNFGQSITDNNEGNPYSQFKFIFSTGAYIDSLMVNGEIRDAYSKKPDNFVTVMLYEANETFNDSTIYKTKPRYVTNTLDSTINYSLQNLKEGRYHLIALKDKSSNYKFDPASDKIAFLKEPITVPIEGNIAYRLDLFQEKRAFKPLKPTQVSSNRYVEGYEGNAKDVKVEVKNAASKELISTLITKDQAKDSIQIWVPRNINTVADSLLVSVNKNDSIKDFVVKTKEMKATDSLSIEAVQKGTLHFRDKFTLRTSTPLTVIDTTKITLINKDSIALPFKMKHDLFKQEVEFDFEKEESQKYTMTLLPGAFKDFYEKENDTLSYNLKTQTLAEYGNMRLTLNNVNRFPVIIELLNEKEEIQASFYSEGETKINFDAILPNTYLIRAIYDDNKNKEWDTGDYLKKIQPEEVIFFPKPIKVKDNWDVEEPFNLGG